MPVFIKLVCDTEMCAENTTVEGHWVYDETGPDPDAVYPAADGWRFVNGEPVLCPHHHQEALSEQRKRQEDHERATYERLRAKFETPRQCPECGAPSTAHNRGCSRR